MEMKPKTKPVEFAAALGTENEQKNATEAVAEPSLGPSSRLLAMALKAKADHRAGLTIKLP